MLPSRSSYLKPVVYGLCFLVLTGCAGILGGESVPTRYYVLSEVPRTDKPPAAASESIIAVVEITMSDYLDTRNFVTRPTENTVDLAQFDQWGAPFRPHVSRTLKNNIANLVPSERVLLSPLSIPVRVDYEIRTDVQRFEQDPTGNVVLEARWGLIDLNNRTAVALHTTSISKPVVVDEPADGDDRSSIARKKYQAIAEAMSAALGDMSREISAVIRSDVAVTR